MSELKRYRVYLTEINEFISAEHHNGEWVKFTDAEAALAERDKRIKELEAHIELMKNCHNCRRFIPYSNVPECDLCGYGADGNQKWEMQD